MIAMFFRSKAYLDDQDPSARTHDNNGESFMSHGKKRRAGSSDLRLLSHLENEDTAQKFLWFLFAVYFVSLLPLNMLK